MRRFGAILAMSAAFIAADGGQADAHRCMEDDPCWNWATMGNHDRGIVTTGGRVIVVKPCRFARLARAGRIDWFFTPTLKGDRTARRSC